MAFLRAGVAAGGATVGIAVAIPVGALLVAFLFEHVGVPIVAGILEDGVREGLNWVEAAFAAIGLVIVGLLVAVIVVAALVAPVFVVLPMVGSAIALRTARAGLITRSLWLSLAMVVLLMLPLIGLAEAGVEVWHRWWVWVLVTAIAAFAGRFLVEVWEPRRAGERSAVRPSRRWIVLLVVWVCLLVVGAVAGTVLFLAVV